MRWLSSFLLLVLLGVAQALSSSGRKLLVVLEEAAEKERFGGFFGDLEARGFHLTFESPKSTSLSLLKHGERAYDHLLLLPAKSKGLGPALTANQLLEFMKKEGNILLTLSGDHATPTAVQSLLLELDIHLPSDRTSLVVDHFNYDGESAKDKHDVLLVPYPKASRPDVKNYFSGEGVIAVPRAVGQTLGNESPLLAPILRAPSTAYSYNPKDEADIVEDPFAVGEQLNLVSTLQAHNSARLTILGSAEMLQDAWFEAMASLNGKAVKTANRDFVAKVSEWAFKETGVLRVGKMVHYLNEGTGKKSNSSAALPQNNPKIYRIKNDVSFQVPISEYSHTHWTPFTPPPSDSVQLEFSMLSPFHRLPLSPLSQTANSTLYGVSFKTPDQHGIFNFRINYRRPFLTNVEVKEQVTVRHFAHDEWPRSWQISGAWVWIAGIWVTVAGWVGFVAIWLYSSPAVGAAKKTQ
ncbi:Dolichyl-diphosphooligosaccharide-protein glycosyltransferase 48kDa subunit [Lindgomyces ingoldianus]|uniref:Dolichyl-diphosphooligosaccharide-protein glycosyltransferase 48kDa subunit n=1 Tax=Lindgomyces ingoldianus TaxID=673940 RepID=A0ACB6QQR1_9PLEO|nr:Dolichyl-diphosphooligosaccharide-protein glycosyltransferase 48kDa subunit [Lindgomyces ingoldianus]KAF2469261.1 Dolichyl-diphosphooligosaccharide-protein glycosyltransferase 48kDa subunit [Lindgomyces ingoldianus]